MQTIQAQSIPSSLVVSAALLEGRALNPFLSSIFADDLRAVFFDSASGFAESCVYVHSTGERKTYKTLFEYPGAQASVVTTLPVSASNPRARFIETDMLRVPTKRDVVIIRNISYTVETVEPDGYGVLTVSLNRRGS